MKKHPLFLIPALALALSSFTNAHEVWIEDTTEGQLYIRFAEFGDDYEKSPGALDALGHPAAFGINGDGKMANIVTEKKSDHFLIVNRTAKEVTCAETSFGVMGGGGKPARKPYFYARWNPDGTTAATPSLNFDIVPTGTLGEARITFRGEPLAAVKATAHFPDGTEQEVTSDGNGLITVPSEKPGLYVITCKHQRETLKGFSAGKGYDTVSHNCSLAWRIAEKKVLSE